mmetsp:Transcript_10865/g.35941  ORF Transcript_10865/g.35941 Transcript_10865/m.35941 type:complete len:225 (-) Transcript_10865:463-1137(-)
MFHAALARSEADAWRVQRDGLAESRLAEATELSTSRLLPSRMRPVLPLNERDCSPAAELTPSNSVAEARQGASCANGKSGWRGARAGPIRRQNRPPLVGAPSGGTNANRLPPSRHRCHKCDSAPAAVQLASCSGIPWSTSAIGRKELCGGSAAAASAETAGRRGDMWAAAWALGSKLSTCARQREPLLVPSFRSCFRTTLTAARSSRARSLAVPRRAAPAGCAR